MTLLPTHHNLVDFASCGVIIFTERGRKEEEAKQLAAEAVWKGKATACDEDGSGVDTNNPVPKK
jgi:hypothetical protein